MKILSKDTLVDHAGLRIFRMVLDAPLISRKARAGQFVVIMASREGERIPLTVVESDSQAGTITIVFQETGFTTRMLGALEPGDSLYALAGPLGHATEIKKYGNVVLLGGGVGVAEIYPVAGSLKQAGNRITVIIGARNKDLLILKKELESLADNFYTATDDGSEGRKGFVTDILEEVLKKEKQDLVYAVGPIPMMKKASFVSGAAGVRAVVSLNALMVDGTGMCGCCRVSVGGQTKFSCVDGPEFEGDKVDWEELGLRNSMYCDKESHICRLNSLKP
ncbi:MAG: sulfide/dihydroorotate dehydrogenase-like FAD/NAD-binding protein [Candidatus Omnitrophota bacterium]